jgi:hypothetical protein
VPCLCLILGAAHLVGNLFKNTCLVIAKDSLKDILLNFQTSIKTLFFFKKNNYFIMNQKLIVQEVQFLSSEFNSVIRTLDFIYIYKNRSSIFIYTTYSS